MSILSPRDLFAGRAPFWVLLLEKKKIGMKSFTCSATKIEIDLVF